MHTAPGTAVRVPSVRLQAEVTAREDEWVLPEADVPESNPHRDAVELLRSILLAFVARSQRDILVAANLGCRWNQGKPSIGVDPDIALLEPAPPEGVKISCLRTWLPGHVPPRFAVEVVSATNASKDYEDAPAKYALLGTRELVVFDPEGLGPASLGGPHTLQVWRREGGQSGQSVPTMTRVYAGEGPTQSAELGAWLVAAEGGRLRIADDPAGSSLWLTEAEEQGAARRQAEAAHRQAEASLRAALVSSVVDVCEAYGTPVDEARRAHLESLDSPALEVFRAAVKERRGWPV